MTDFGGKTSIFSHPVYLFLRKFSLQDSRGGSNSPVFRFPVVIRGFGNPGFTTDLFHGNGWLRQISGQQ
ncbi:hypothetical protein DW834_23660 [Escherichia coli]|nr:hypothetical protein DW834_23660 [Escherichia coli]